MPPRCGMSEDARHVWRCQANSIHALWEFELPKLYKWLQEKNTDLRICSAIMRGLATGTHQVHPSLSRVLPNGLTEELSNQAARTTWPGLLSRGDTSPTTILYLLLMAE